MEFTHYDLGHLEAGSIVRVSLSGTEANVLLLDSANLTRYRNGSDHRYYGGHYRQSPVILTVPQSGYWHVAVDLGGFVGQVRSEVEVLPPQGFGLAV